MSSNNLELSNSNTIGLKSITILMYGLQAFSFLFGLTGIAAIIINYLKFGKSINTIYESHFCWLRRTFWFSLLWAIIGIITSEIFIGIFILIANAIWIIYRVIKGLLLILKNQPIQKKNYNDKSLMLNKDINN